MVWERGVSLHYAAVPAQPWAALERAWLPRLPGSKRAAILRLRDAADRNASLLGLALLDAALAARGCVADLSAVEFPPRAKPHLPGSPDFSIAHAGGLVGCALAAAGRVGFDLEARGAVQAGQLRRVLDAAEQARVAAGALDPTEAWVMKEAVLKAAGRGIEAAAQVHLAPDHGLLGAQRFGLLALDLSPAHVAWLAYEGSATLEAPVRVAPGSFAALP